MLKDLPTCARSSTLRTCPQIPKCLDMQGLQRKGQYIEQELSQIISNHRERLPFPHSDIYKLYVRAHIIITCLTHTHTRVCIYIYMCVCVYVDFTDVHTDAHANAQNCIQMHTNMHTYMHTAVHAYLWTHMA